MKKPLLYLSPEDVCLSLPMPDAIAAMREAFMQLGRGEVTLPERQRIEAPSQHGAALVMSCHSSAEKLFSLKFITLFDQNRGKGLPLIHALVLLADGVTGEPVAVMDGAKLTALRTGAVSGVATDLLARREASVAAIFGAGVQARTQLEAVACVRSLRHAFVYDANHGAAERFAEEMSESLSFPVECAADSASALAEADIVCTATTSATPVFEDGQLKPGVHINAIGSYRPHVAEVPPATVRRARVVVDHRASALEEAGDLLMPLRQGLIEEAHFRTELGEILLGRAPGRRREDDITIFKSVGVAIQDLAAGARALQNALRLKRGVQLAQDLVC